MRSKVLAALALAAALLSTPMPGSAQVTGVAFVAFSPGGLRENGVFFLGPWRPTETGMDVLYAVTCINTADPTRKVVGEVAATFPNGSSLSDMRTISTTAVVNFCASPGTNPHLGITVNRGAVLLPAIQQGL